MSSLRVFASNISDGTPATGIANTITCSFSLDYTPPSSVADTNPTELSDGNYLFDLAANEVDGLQLEYYPVSSISGIQVDVMGAANVGKVLHSTGLDKPLISELTASVGVGSSVDKLFNLMHVVTSRKSTLTRTDGSQIYFDQAGTSGVLQATQTDNGITFAVSDLTKS